MPIYEYRCQACGKKQSVFFRSMAAAEAGGPQCERCGSRRMARLMSRVRVVRGGGPGAAAGDASDAMMDEMAGLDESDPRALGRYMRQMAAESGEDMGPEFDEVIGRLEKGEDPEKIERSMGDVFGAGPDGMGMDDDFGAPSPTTPSADKADEAKDKAATEKKRTIAMKGKPAKPARASSTRRKKSKTQTR